MHQDKPKYNLNYPELSIRRYGPVIHNGPFMTLVEPLDILLARAFITRQKELDQAVMDFVDARGDYKILNPENDYFIRYNAAPGKKPQKISLWDLDPESVLATLEDRLKKKENHKIRWGSAQRAVKNSFAGGLNFSGFAASRTRGWHHVHITSPFNNNKSPLQSVYCDCPDARYIREKLGSENITHLDFHGSLLLMYAQEHPDMISGLGELLDGVAAKGFFLPYKSDSMHIAAEALIAEYLVGIPRSEISRRLQQYPELYEPKLLSMLGSGRADFQVLPSKDYTNVYSGEVRNLYNKIREVLESDSKYHISGYALEKKGTTDEAVGLNFMHRDRSHVIRIVTAGGPPLIVRRTLKKGTRDIFSKDTADQTSLWEDLYKKPFKDRDDSSRMMSDCDVRLPLHPKLFIPDNVYLDYAIALRQYFHGRIGKLQERLYAARAERRIDYSTIGAVMKMINKR